jgi:uncharacterized protein
VNSRRRFAAALLLCAVCFAALPGCGRPADSDGLVWKVTGTHAPIYLAGSFHLLRAKDLPHPAPYATAYAASTRVIFELPAGEMQDPAVARQMQELAKLPPSETLSARLTPTTLSQLRAAGLSADELTELEPYRPWMAALILGMKSYSELGADPRYGLEHHFSALAQKDAKPITGLETAAGQLSLFAQLTPAAEEQMLAQTLDDLATAKGLITDLLATWRAGDADRLHTLIDKGFANYPDLRRLLLTDRNHAWLPTLESQLRDAKDATFVLVGAAHLCGPDGLPTLLQQRGYQVERVRTRQ